MDVPVNELPWQGEFPDVANWSENFCLAGYDPECGVGFWFHIGRWRHDKTMWREIVVMRFPDGTVAAHRAIGNARASTEGGGGPCFSVRVLESGRRLHYSFNGGVMRVSAATMLEGIVGDGRKTPFTFELDFVSDSDIWDLHKVGSLQAFLPAGHIEQPGQLTGAIRIGDDHYDFNAIVNRDHSLGARDNKDLHSHQWLQGYFENGIKFMLFDAKTKSDGKVVFSEAIVYEGDRAFEAKIESIERCERVEDDEKPIRITLSYANGTLDIDTVAYHGSSYLSLTSPNDQYVGVYKSDPGPTLVLDEQSVTLTLNGTVAGYGAYERTIPGFHKPEA
ncbi:MAG: hypothetical protein JWL66_2513 [Sphingomonadales bacterium]|nr:hypothetical protein [Sphingomonadales bacterium]